MTSLSKEEGSQFVDAGESSDTELNSKSSTLNMLASSSKSMETDISTTTTTTAKSTPTLPIAITPNKSYNSNNNNNNNNTSNNSSSSSSSNASSILQTIASKRKFENNESNGSNINNNSNNSGGFMTINSKYNSGSSSGSLISEFDEKDENTITTILSNSIEQSLKNQRNLNGEKKVQSVFQDPTSSSISRSNSTEPEFETTNLRSILESLNRNVNSSNIFYFFPRDQFYNFICIYKGCHKPIRSRSFEQYIFHLKVHESSNHILMDNMLNSDGTSNLNENELSLDGSEQAIEEAISFTQDSTKKYEALFSNFEQQQEAIIKTIIPFNETTTKKRRPDRYNNNSNSNSNNSNRMDEDDGIDVSFDGFAIRSTDNVQLFQKGNKNRLQQPTSQQQQSLFNSKSSIPNSPPLNNTNLLNQPQQNTIGLAFSQHPSYLQQQQQQQQQQQMMNQDYNQVYPSSFPPPSTHGNHFNNKQSQTILASSTPGPFGFGYQQPEDEKYATPTRYSSRGVQLREQMIKYGLKLFRMDSEGKYICFFSGCNLHMITNFSRHVAKHEKVGDVIKPELYHLSNLYQSQMQNPSQAQPPQAPQLIPPQQIQLQQQQQQPMNIVSPPSVGYKSSSSYEDTDMYGVNQESDHDSRYNYHVSPRGQQTQQPSQSPFIISNNNNNNNSNSNNSSASTSPPTSSSSTPLFYSQQQRQSNINIPQPNGETILIPTSPLSISANSSNNSNSNSTNSISNSSNTASTNNNTNNNSNNVNGNTSNGFPPPSEINWVFKRK